MPGYQMDTGKRSKTVKVVYYDLVGNKQIVVLSDMTAVIVQHEIDHLLGIMMVDYLDQSLIK